jgi:hypothetical protein
MVRSVPETVGKLKVTDFLSDPVRILQNSYEKKQIYGNTEFMRVYYWYLEAEK